MNCSQGITASIAAKGSVCTAFDAINAEPILAYSRTLSFKAQPSAANSRSYLLRALLKTFQLTYHAILESRP